MCVCVCACVCINEHNSILIITHRLLEIDLVIKDWHGHELLHWICFWIHRKKGCVERRHGPACQNKMINMGRKICISVHNRHQTKPTLMTLLNHFVNDSL